MRLRVRRLGPCLRRGDGVWGKQGEPRFGEDTVLQPVIPAQGRDSRSAAEGCGDPEEDSLAGVRLLARRI